MPKNICKSCVYAKNRFREACYCVKYGIIISYGKEACTGYYQDKKELEEEK